MRVVLLTCILFCSLFCFAQWRAGVLAGAASYLGELNDKPYARTKPAIGGSITYEVSHRFAIRGNAMAATLEGGDQWSGDEFKKLNRNLSFRSRVLELSLLGELTLFDMDNWQWSPYGFAGLAVFQFNPYVYNGSEKVFLKPIGTEGQGTPSGQGQNYQLIQLALPFGGGVKFNMSDRTQLGLEVGLRRTFTDYLDDVSTNYPDRAELLALRGQRGLQYSFRGGEVPGDAPGFPDGGFPDKGAVRGNPKVKDFYYFTALHLSVRLGGGYGKTYSSGGRRSRTQYGCPVI